MTKLKSLLIASFLFSSITSFASTNALFSPHQGKEAFHKIFNRINNSDDHVYLTVYSWSIKNLEPALMKALDNGADVRIVINPSIAKKLSSKITNLELAGAHVKKAYKSMHEKFVLIDGDFLVNTSANMSSGAQSRYSESFIFHYPDNDNEKQLLNQFYIEFQKLWNSGSDIFTHNEDIASKLDLKKPTNKTQANLYSSSQNFIEKENNKKSKAFKRGQYNRIKYKGSWVVQNMLIDQINKAQKSIYLNLNHFNLSTVADALINAVKRGVEVKFNVDNQYSNYREVTIRNFIKPWYKLKGKNTPAPVRVKFYSLIPSPKYWKLNHHKSILIDFELGDKASLIAGSYNISKTAETNQMDNMVLYTGKSYQNLYKDFYNEFQNLWTLNRTEDDLPSQKVLDYFRKPMKNIYRLHQSTPIALSHEEVVSFQKEMAHILPEILNYKARKKLYKNRNCYGYSPSKELFVGCN